MKNFKLIIILALITANNLKGQTIPIIKNISRNLVETPTVIPPTPALVPPATAALAPQVESFRFGSGLITQLDQGDNFTFENDKRWFSLGRLNVGPPSNPASQRTLYGLRLQRSGQALTFGYGTPFLTPNVATNPFIEWIGNSGLSSPVTSGNLEFYTAGSPLLPASRKLSFTLRSDLTAFFGETSTFASGLIKPSKVEINVTDNRDGLAVFLSNNSAVLSKCVSFVNDNAAGNAVGLDVSSSTKNINGESIGVNINAGVGDILVGTGRPPLISTTGVVSFAGGGTARNTSVSAKIQGDGSDNYGTKIDARCQTGINNYGLFSNLLGNSAANTINYGIYSSASGSNSLAGFFNGNVTIISGGVLSDIMIKKDIKTEKNMLDLIKNLNPVNYLFKQEKEKNGLNLPTTLQHGFIAQEIEKVFPELVLEVTNPIYDDNSVLIGKKVLKTVNYIELISVLVGAVKELSTKLEILETNAPPKTFVISDSSKLSQSELDKLSVAAYSLDQNVPNPFSDFTVINYSLPADDKNASIMILNLNGQLIKEYKLTDTKGSITITSGTLQKGMYLYSLVSNNVEIMTKKMILK